MKYLGVMAIFFFAILPTFGTFYNFMATNLASFPLSNMVGLVGIEWG